MGSCATRGSNFQNGHRCHGNEIPEPNLSGAFLRDRLTYKDETSQDCYPPQGVLIFGLEIFNMAAVAMETKQEQTRKLKVLQNC